MNALPLEIKYEIQKHLNGTDWLHFLLLNKSFQSLLSTFNIEHELIQRFYESKSIQSNGLEQKVDFTIVVNDFDDTATYKVLLSLQNLYPLEKSLAQKLCTPLAMEKSKQYFFNRNEEHLSMLSASIRTHTTDCVVGFDSSFEWKHGIVQTLVYNRRHFGHSIVLSQSENLYLPPTVRSFNPLYIIDYRRRWSTIKPLIDALTTIKHIEKIYRSFVREKQCMILVPTDSNSYSIKKL